MTSREKVAALRRLMKQEGLAAYYVPTDDPHMSEYPPECWKRRRWLTGFTGSAGEAVVTQRDAGLWTDSRYFLQAAGELDARVFTLFKKGLPKTPTVEAHLCARLRKGDVVGADARVLSLAVAGRLEKALAEKGLRLGLSPRNLVDAIWEDQPALPADPITRVPDRRAGETVAAKLARLRAELERQGADAHLVTTLDAIAWLFNIRGTDVEFNPVMVAYALVTRRGATLFLDREKVPAEVRRALRGVCRLVPYADVHAALRQLGRRKACVLIDPLSTNRWVVQQLRGARLVAGRSPVAALKAVKNASEVRGMREAHIRDGVAMVRFLHWLESVHPTHRYTESEVARAVEAFRAEERGFRGPSFETIVGFGPNAAVIHYRPVAGRDLRLRKHGVLLIDSGGQYTSGTTDITRTIALGTPPRRAIRLHTLVLKSHIGLARAVFPQGTTGQQLEVLAKATLWREGLDYLHGTGHGVGAYLNVHEGPVSFSARGSTKLAPGNTLSVEPGFYEAGRYGFRVENLVVVKRDPVRSTATQGWCLLEALTLCPIDRRLIDARLLTEEERAWVNDYHRRVDRTLAPHLSRDVRGWLRAATRPL